MVTSREDVRDKVAALDAGADDYIVKPFDLAELSARIRAVSRRQGTMRDPVLECGSVRLDPSCHQVTYNGTPIPLTGTEYRIFETLMRNPSQVFSRAMLRDKLAGFDDGLEPDSIKTHITNLRRKFRSAGGTHDPVENVYGIGYRLADFCS
jgi:two-component system, OmpR family, response regulator QseB